MRPWSPMGGVQRVKQPEQLVGRQLRGTPAERQRIQPNRRAVSRRINQHNVSNPIRRDALQHVRDQIALRLDHHHRPASRACLE